MFADAVANSYLAAFLIQSKTICLGMVLPIMMGALPHKLTISLNIHMPTVQSDLDNSSIEAFLLDDSKVSQVDN